MLLPTTLRRNLPVVAAALSNIIIFVAVLSIPLTAAQSLGLSAMQTSSWIMALYGLPALVSLALTIAYRQPILATGNLFMMIFISGLGSDISYSALVGAAVLAGAAVLVIGILGLTARLASWIPIPVMFGMLAGAVMPFVFRIFTALGSAPALVGGTFLVYLVSRALLRDQLPPILPALVAGLTIAAFTGQFGEVPPLALTVPELTLPIFSLPAVLTATPVFIVLIVIQANLPSLLFLKSQGYDPPVRVINIGSGVCTMLGSLLGPTGVSLSLPATSLVAGADAGEQSLRHRSVYLVAVAALVVAVLASMAAALPEIIPPALLVTLAGLAVVNVLAGALQQITQGPLLLGPLFAFAIALSEISFLGFGNFFWALVIGTVVSLLLERDGLRSMREEAAS